MLPSAYDFPRLASNDIVRKATAQPKMGFTSQNPCIGPKTPFSLALIVMKQPRMMNIIRGT